MANTKVKAEQLEAAQTNITSLGTLTSLQVNNTNINGNTISTTDTNGNLVITPNGTGNVNINTDTVAIMGAEGESAKLSLQADEADDNADVWSIISTTSNTLEIENNISGSAVAHMTLTPNATVASSTVTIPGKVGIGATSLTRELTVQENGQADISIVAATNQYGQLLFGDTDADNKGIVAYNNSTDILEFWTSGSRRMAIDSGGHIGIKTTTREDGSTAMAFPLTINGGDDSGNIIEAFRTANSKFQLYMSTGGTVYADVTGTTPLLKIRTSGTDRVNIHEANGYVGLIGSSDVRLTLSSQGTEGDNSANWVRGNSAGLSFNAKTSGKFMWEIGGTEKMRMESDGDVVIGTTSGDAKLSVYGESSGGFNSFFSSGTAYQNFTIFFDTANGNGTANFRPATLPGSGVANMAFRFRTITDGTGTTNANVVIDGSLSKGSGSFLIDHPLESMTETHHLYHSFIEGPQADLIYRGKVELVNGKATINIDEVSNMTEGTFCSLNTDTQCFTTNETDWDAVKGSVEGNILTIECQNASSSATISWMVVGERCDKHMLDTDWTDDNGKVIPERIKPENYNDGPVLKEAK